MAGGSSALPIGTVVHQRYRILAVVGQGGLGTVYQVSDVLFGKNNIYALKELIDQSSGARKQFENESQWLQSLDHNHIPKVREHFEWERRLYLVMDFVDGENLEQKLARMGGRGLPEQQVLAWVLPICDALHYLHGRIPPILHRDVKPANIIVTPAGHPVLVDLGIAKEHLPGANQTATFVRKAGTEGYAPPEQYTLAGQTGPWSDVYGMGATLYQLLTGGLPPTAVERVALDRRLIHPRDVDPMITMRADAVVCKALELRPSDRFQSMLDLKLTLMGQKSLPATYSSPQALPSSPSGPMPPFGTQMPTSPPAASPMPLSVPPARPPAPPSAPLRAPATPPWRGSMGTGSLGMGQRGTGSPGTGSLPRIEMTGRQPAQTALSTRPGLNSEGKLAVPSGEALVAAARAAARAASSPPRKQRRGARLRLAPTLIAVVALCIIVAGVIFGAAWLREVTPPDRSTAQATVNGYFDALKAQDYERAWQFAAASRTDAPSQDSFISGLTGDDSHYGRVLSYTVERIETDNSGRASAQVRVTRAQSPGDPMTYTVVLTQYGGDTWLINSVSTS
jgi:serine/threonine protein kinase